MWLAHGDARRAPLAPHGARIDDQTNVALHFDGAGFSLQSPDGAHRLHAIHGTAPDEVWAGGHGGFVVHWDGAAWKEVPVGTTNQLFAVRARSRTDVWVAGDYGLVLHWNGTTWATRRVGISSALSRIAASHPRWVSDNADYVNSPPMPGKASNRRLPAALQTRALGLVRERYADFGPTLAGEKLHELHGVDVSRETLRKWMAEVGIWLTRDKRAARAHQPRHRRACLGGLVQIDGSPHAWFEDRCPSCSLLVYVDDATGRLMELRFVKERGLG